MEKTPQNTADASRRAVEGDRDKGVARPKTSLISPRRPSPTRPGAGGISIGQQKDEETLTPNETESGKETPDEPTSDEAGVPPDREEEGPTS